MGRLVEINPAVPGFDDDPSAEVTFMPLECVWPDGLANTSRRELSSSVANGYTRFRDGDILLPKITPTFEAGRVFPVSIETKFGAATTEVHVLRAYDGVDARYIAYVCRSQPFLQDGSTRLQGVGNLRRVPVDFIFRFPVEVTDLTEQTIIADYLDREIAKINALIKEQQRLIELLIERRVSVLERGVAELPWDTPIRAVSRLVQTGPFGSQLKFNEYQPGGIPVINPSHLSAGRIKPDPSVAVSAAKATALNRHALRSGDLVLARRGELGRCAVVTHNEAGYLCGTGCAVIRPRQERILPDFLAVVFGSQRNREALALQSVGSTMENLNADIVSSLRIPVPDLDVQRQVLANTAVQLSRIDELIAEAERFIELVRERRAALITAAVTGQIDVREKVGTGVA